MSLRLFCLLLFLVPAVQAGQLRVTTWNLQPRADAETNVPISETAIVLKTLNPDVILLQQVPSLAACEELVRALKPAEYEIASCSELRDSRTGEPSRHQTAILSKLKPVTTSSFGWQTDGAPVTPGGFAFAVIKIENRYVGFFSTQFGDGSISDDHASSAQQAAREEAARQLAMMVEKSRMVSSNGFQSALIAGDFNTSADDPKLSGEMTLARFERAGFSNAFGNLPLEKRVTLPGNGSRPDATTDYIFARDFHAVSAQVTSATFAGHQPVTANLELTAPIVAAVTPPIPRAEAHSVEKHPVQSDAPSLGSIWQSFVTEAGPTNIWWLAGLLVVGLAMIALGTWMLARRNEPLAGASPAPRNSPSTGPASKSPATPGDLVIVTRSTQTGSSIAHGPAASMTPVVRVEAPVYSPATQNWRERAEAAERRADRATDAVRQGLLPHLAQWLKSRFTQRLISDRSQLLAAQQAAALKMQAVDDRLTKVEQQIQQRIRDYEQRIDELQDELTAAREENRELIRSKIAQVRADMEKERARLVSHGQER